MKRHENYSKGKCLKKERHTKEKEKDRQKRKKKTDKRERKRQTKEKEKGRQKRQTEVIACLRSKAATSIGFDGD